MSKPTACSVKSKFVFLFFATVVPLFGYSQSLVVPESVKRKCANTSVKDRVRLAVARFSKTTDVGNSRNIDNFATMLSNAMFEIECFRMLSTINDANYKFTGSESPEIRPHYVVTGEITEYDHSVQQVKMPGGKAGITKYNAHIGFILQIKDPISKEIVFSKSFNQSASSTNAQMGSHSNSQTVDKAYHNALEKGILDAVTYIVDNRDKIYEHVHIISGNVEGGVSGPTSRFQVFASKATFAQLMEIERSLTAQSRVQKVEKKLVQSRGEMNVTMTGTIDDLAAILTESFADRLVIDGFDAKKLTISLK